MGSDGILFTTVIIFFFLLWFVSGGPTKPISFSGPYITPITDTGQTQFGYDAEQWFGGNPTGGAGLFGGQQSIQGIGSIFSGDADKVKAFGDPSPYRGQITITSVSSGTGPDDEYVTLQMSSSATGPLTISGWRLRSDATYKSGTIPNGTETPKTGVNSTGPITLQPGDRAIVLTGEAPTGVSFRENMCVGYFSKRQAFYPSLSGSCPSPMQEFDRFYDGNKLADDSCYQFVQTISQCVSPTDTPNLTGRCEEFIDDYLDYNGCVAAHQQEAGFKSQDWRIYLERSGDLWKPDREAVKLLDANGKTVDLYTY